jgi:acetate kinase
VAVLVLNSGSSTLKYAVIEPASASKRTRGVVAPSDLDAILTAVSPADRAALTAVGHRIVHGGPRFTRPTLIDDDVLASIRELVPLAPLHNPAGIAGIEAARAALPDLPQVAVFDTAFHHTLPDVAFTYAIDRAVAERLRIRRYGFHGTSVRYVAEQTAVLLNRPLGELNLIVLHLGNGASATAVAGGVSVETSMGFTPLEGLVMGTRGGDVDPGLLVYLQRTLGLSVDELDDLLQHHSGVFGLCGDSDMRAVTQRRAEGDRSAALAFDAYCHRIRAYVGAYHAILGRLDAIAFTAGIGENSAPVREHSLAGLDGWGIAVDPGRNEEADGARVISPPGTRVTVCVVPTDEELAIARDVVALLTAQSPP